jgi:hypothetical protein
MVRIRWVTDDVIARAIGGRLLATFVAAVVWTFVAVPQQHRRAAPSEPGRASGTHRVARGRRSQTPVRGLTRSGQRRRVHEHTFGSGDPADSPQEVDHDIGAANP